ncbi:transposase [Hornefia butyriciproducens]|uniref:transposase n=1 Tax=Hornefia butyriciproducens TaxID=2652293 RepID=UPI003F8C2448
MIREGGDRKYDKEFKLQALELADEIGVKAAAEQLGIKYYTLADWRRQRKAHGKESFVGSGNKMIPLSEKDRRI